MGDNRNNSGRQPAVGPISTTGNHRERICVYWPIGQWKTSDLALAGGFSARAGCKPGPRCFKVCWLFCQLVYSGHAGRKIRINMGAIEEFRRGRNSGKVPVFKSGALSRAFQSRRGKP